MSKSQSCILDVEAWMLNLPRVRPCSLARSPPKVKVEKAAAAATAEDMTLLIPTKQIDLKHEAVGKVVTQVSENGIPSPFLSGAACSINKHRRAFLWPNDCNFSYILLFIDILVSDTILIGVTYYDRPEF